MIFIPSAAKAMTRLCADDTARYALQSVRVTLEPGQLFRLEATDGKIMGILRGPNDANDRDRELAKLLSCPPSLLREVLVPKAALNEALAALSKEHKARRRSHTVAHPTPPKIALMLSNPIVMQVGSRTFRELPGEGRFPDVSAVLPKGPPLVSFHVNAALLCDLLEAIMAMQSPENPRVTVHFYRAGAPIGLSASTPEGLAFDGLIMPCT